MYLPCRAQNGYIQRDGTLLRDGFGRALLLRGLNYVNKDKAHHHLNLRRDTAFIQMKNWGYNAVRLGVNWAALEPSPNEYDQHYLSNLDSLLRYAMQHGIYVILDMHQDLYGEKFGGGAPAWATLDDGKPHRTGGTWSDAYYISPAVQTSFDNFWANKPASDGIGVQDHYIKTWAMLAERYKNDKNIIGFDVMNEPFIGSDVDQAMNVIISEMTMYLNRSNTDKTYTQEEVSQMWISEKGKEFILQTLRGKDVFYRVLQGMEPIYRRFEETKLMPFYKKLAIAIRSVNPHHILFWEPSVSSNNGIPTTISPIPEAGNQQGFMPHVYDIVLDTRLAGNVDAERVAFMFSNLRQTEKRMNLPTLIGEWGAFYSGNNDVVKAAKLFASEIDSLLAGDFYWDYFDGLDQQVYFKDILQRPYMQAVAGTIVSQTTGENSLTVSWKETPGIKAPSLIYLPHTRSLKVIGKAKYKLIAFNDKGWDILEIAPIGRNKFRKLEISWKD